MSIATIQTIWVDKCALNKGNGQLCHKNKLPATTVDYTVASVLTTAQNITLFATVP